MKEKPKKTWGQVRVDKGPDSTMEKIDKIAKRTRRSRASVVKVLVEEEFYNN